MLSIDDLSDVEVTCEATDFERYCIWERFHNSELSWPWESARVGKGLTVGFVEDMPVCISISKARVNGKVVLFYCDTSQIVDHRMIEEWRKDNLAGVQNADAQNFCNLFY